MLPGFTSNTGYLPPGIHTASWDELESKFAWNSHRRHMMVGLLGACRNLAAAGCQHLWLDGSFVTSKPLPNDYDGAWEVGETDVSLLDSVLLDLSHARIAMKNKYYGELFPASAEASPGIPYREFFTRDRDDVQKGIVLLRLEEFV